MISQVASRYAEALFQLAEEENQLSEIYSEIEDLNKLILDNKNLYDVLRSPFIGKDEKLDIADKLFTDKLSRDVRNFLMVLIENRRTTEPVAPRYHTRHITVPPRLPHTNAGGPGACAPGPPRGHSSRIRRP